MKKAQSGSKTAANIKASTSDPNFYYYDGKVLRIATKEEIEVMTVAELGPYQEWARAQGLARNGQIDDAKRKIAGLLDGHPLRMHESLALAEIALFEENYDEALLILAPFVSGSTDEWTLVMAAYAGAMTGNVFVGQMEYCQGNLAASNGLRFQIAPTKRGMSRTATARLIATMAMANKYEGHGMEFATRRYLEKTIYLDPDNSWANYGLAIIHR